ncbi:MAG: hypothetical protein ABI306_11365 [Caulobacteraceae bacterium]
MRSKLDRNQIPADWLLAAVLAAMAPASASAAGVCAPLSTFEHAAFAIEAATSPSAHWVELHWLGNWLDFGGGWRLECRHSSDGASTTLCAWLTGNTSFEFHDRLPRAILICHGYRFPDLSYWDDWKAQIELSGGPAVDEVLDIDQTAHKTPDVAIRLTVFPIEEGRVRQSMPPLFRNSDEAPENGANLN